MNAKQVLKILQQHGFRLLRISGSHRILADSKRRVAVPVHGAQGLKPGILKRTEKQAGVKLP